MTKPRDPQSFEEAALVMARDFGPVEAGKIVDRGAATLRHWSDPDKDGRPTLHQALRLDVEHLKQFHTAPFLQAYIAQLKERAPEAEQTRAVGDLLSEALDVPEQVGRLVGLIRRARDARSVAGAKISACERAGLQKELKRLRDEIDDVEAAIRKS